MFCSAGMEAEKTLLVNKLAPLAESNKELVEKNNQLNKERKDEAARLTSDNTKLKEQLTKLDKDFSSKLSTTQLLIPFSIIHHAQYGLMFECNRAPKHQDTPRSTNKGEGALDIEVQCDGRRNKACARPDQHGT
jgi:cellobiose-specific phosphotransferase system component IIB